MIPLDLRYPATHGNRAMPVRFKPSAWMWQHRYDSRIHMCFSFWLTANWCWPTEKWTPYRCDHYDRHGEAV